MGVAAYFLETYQYSSSSKEQHCFKSCASLNPNSSFVDHSANWQNGQSDICNRLRKIF